MRTPALAKKKGVANNAAREAWRLFYDWSYGTRQLFHLFAAQGISDADSILKHADAFERERERRRPAAVVEDDKLRARFENAEEIAPQIFASVVARAAGERAAWAWDQAEKFADACEARRPKMPPPHYRRLRRKTRKAVAKPKKAVAKAAVAKAAKKKAGAK